ncbi:hypothetical protein ABUE31_21635 [Mesorhizobium sp. ZMM04-5]|uniref:F5/8 type C domain-containing protein n=1 Tax=Mesorhizobium marinum TaxID=3228790 RepID=A0ABV3R5X0_9HYPH
MPVVISPALVLSELAAGSADAPLLGWHNLVTRSGIEADQENESFPATNLANPSTALRWQGESTATQYLTFTVSSADDVDYVGIARHNLGSGQVTVSVEVSDGGSPEEWTEIIDELIPPSDQPLVLRFEAQPVSRIRIKFQPTATIPRMAVVHVGKLLRLPRGVQPSVVPLTWAVSDDVVSAQSEAGDYLGAIVLHQALATSVQIQWLDYAWWNANMPGFIAHARQSLPFFFAWLPHSFPFEVGYAWSTNDIRPDAQRVAAGVTINFKMDLKAVAL